MEGLVDPDQLPDPAAAHQVVQIRHGFAGHQAAPALPLGEYAEKVGAFLIPAHPVRIPVIGEEEQKAVFRRENVPHRQISGGGHHLPIEVVRVIAIGVFVKIGNLPPGQKPRLVLLAVGPEIGHGFLGGGAAAQQGNVLPDQLRHPRLQPGGVEVRRARDPDVEAGADGAVHLRHGLRPELPHRQKQHELGRPGVGIPAAFVSVAQQPDLSFGGGHGPADHLGVLGGILPHRDVVQGKYLPGDLGHQGPAGQQAGIQPQAPHQLQQALPGRGTDGFAVNRKLHKPTSIKLTRMILYYTTFL